MTQFLIWIIPPIFYFLMVWFFRKQVEYPHVPRFAYFGIIPVLIPVLGLVVSITILVSWIVFSCTGDIGYKEDTKFAKRWLD